MPTRPVDGARVVVSAPAKVNLRLRVLAREVSGYHQLETLFCALELADTLEIERAGRGIDLEVEGARLGPPEDNLVFRAARAFYDTTGIEPGVRIVLRKRIPSGAGMGGGSSDAASTLLALDALYDAPVGRAELLRIGAALGSDVPFFLCGSPLAFAWGRGERLLTLPPLPRRPVLVAAPDFSISTPDAFRALDSYVEENDAGLESYALEGAALVSWREIAALGVNDFEPPTFARFPQLRRVRDALLAAGADLALLSGSGAALFAVFPDDDARDRAASELRTRFPTLRLFETATATTVPGPAGTGEFG